MGQPPQKMRSGEELLRGPRSTLEQTPLREILLLGKSAHGWAIFLKRFSVKTFKLKISLIRNNLNFTSI
jgi:hypothetical protein